MDRRNSDQDQTPRRPANPNVFDDEYALDPDEDDFMPTVSDGFRPAGVSGNEARNEERHNHDRNDARPPFTTPLPPDADLRRVASRNSTVKPPFAREFASHDARNPPTHHSRGPSSQATAALQHRASISSTGSFATMTPSESPFAGGPSHPYGMYPQHTMARSSSGTTSSTQRQPHRSISLQRPTHPYGMYPQNVIEDEPPMPTVQSAIPVGFPGLNTGYHRQIGPDGEEQDILGPDGHTEQLPPYSRYPEEGPTKAAMAAEASSIPVSEPVDAPPNASDEALITPLTPLLPLIPAHSSPTQRQIDLIRNNTATATATDTPETRIAATQASSMLSASERGSNEKAESIRSRKGWRSKKLWGKVPMGVALVLLVLLLIFAVILGAAIGTFVAKNREKSEHTPKHGKDREEPSPVVTGSSGSLFDATPIPTPSSLSPLPFGPFALPLGVPQESSPNCLTIAAQLSAWSCKMPFAPLVLNVTVTNPGSGPSASLESPPMPDAPVQYGVQPPTVGWQDLQLVSDLDLNAYGPAYHFYSSYDKLVVLSQEDFQAGANLKRDEKPQYRHRFQVAPGENPWFCFWNSTYIEGYIYVNHNSSAATMSAFPTPWPTNTYGATAPMDTAAATAVDTGSPAPATPTPAAMKKRGDNDYTPRMPYARVVKIEERRLPGSPQPYCQKMQLLDNGTMVAVMDSSQRPIIVYLQENDPTLAAFLSAGGSPSSPSASASPNTNTTERRQAGVEKRTDPNGACHCQWMFQ